jgi:SAM-dependent methyltransferase
MSGWMKRSRQRLDAWLTDHDLAHTLSLAKYRLHAATLPLIIAYARGVVLDAGSGRSPYKRMLTARGLKVISIDIEDRAGEIDQIADLQDMPAIADASVDTVLCTQVLEHVPRPWNAMREIARVLRPGGAVVLSVPHLSAIHEAPHDYYRYTQYGLRALAQGAGLEVIELEATAGLVAFLAHPLSYLLLTVPAGVPVVREMAWAINRVILIAALGLVDRLAGFRRVYPCDYVLAARKGSP